MSMENRHEYLGSSEVAAVLGLSPYQSPMDVWNSKKLRETIPDNPYMYWGRTLEPIVGQEFAKRNNVTLIDAQREYRDDPIRTHIDFWIEEWNCPLEIKTSSAFTAPWLDGVPTHYYTQCQVQMKLTNSDKAYVALLKGGNDYSEHIVKRMLDNELDMMMKSVKLWWKNYIVGNNRPPLQTIDEINALFPKARDGDSIVISNDDVGVAVENAIAKLHEATATIKEAENTAEDNKAIIKAYMGEHAQLIDRHGETAATWKNVNRRPKVNWKNAITEEMGEEWCKTFIDKHEEKQDPYRAFRLPKVG